MRGHLRSLGMLAALALNACGGGGGGGAGQPPANGPRLTLNASSISFQSPSPFQSFELAPFTLTGSIGTTDGLSGILYVVIEVGNGSIITADNFLINSPTGGSVVIRPAIPVSLGAGVHQTTITVRACMNSPGCTSNLISGSPVTVPVTYTVPSNVLRASVTPAAVAASRTTNVVLRGSGFNNVNSVNIGGQAAAFTRVSSSEIRVTVPSLPAGSYPVFINGGAIAFSANVAVVAEPAFAATTIPLPPGVTAQEIERLIYDAPRLALLAVARLSGGSRVLYRYVYNAGWTQATSLDVSGYRDLDLAPAGDRLYLVRPTQISVLDPVTLQSTATINRPSTFGPIDEFYSISLANDGYAVVTATFSASGSLPVHMLATTDFTFTRLVEMYSQGTGTAVIPDGSRVGLDPYTGYNPSTASIASNQLFGWAPLFPRALGYRLSGITGFTTCDAVLLVNSNGTSSLAGDMPVGSRTVGCGTDPWVEYAYIIDASGDFSVWNVLAAPVAGVYSRINAPYSVPGINTSQVNVPMPGAVSLDRRTHFVGTNVGVVVMPSL